MKKDLCAIRNSADAHCKMIDWFARNFDTCTLKKIYENKINN